MFKSIINLAPGLARSISKKFPLLIMKYRVYLLKNSEPEGYYIFNRLLIDVKEKYKNVNGYDFGSNYGVYSYIMKNFCDKIYAFEPNLEAFKYLEKWTKKFDNIQIYNKAVSDKNSKIKIYVPIDKNNNISYHRFSSIYKDNINKIIKKNINIKEYEIDTCSLLDYDFANDAVKIFKCDVEGHEIDLISTFELALKNKIFGIFEVSKLNKNNSIAFFEKIINKGDLYYFDTNLTLFRKIYTKEHYLVAHKNSEKFLLTSPGFMEEFNEHIL